MTRRFAVAAGLAAFRIVAMPAPGRRLGPGIVLPLPRIAARESGWTCMRAGPAGAAPAPGAHLPRSPATPYTDRETP